MLIREAFAQGSADLKFAEIKTPGLDASLLLAHVLNMSRTSLAAEASKKLTEKQCAAFCELIERRCAGECVAYIIGKKEFMGLEFAVNNSVLVPRPDTEILVEAALKMGTVEPEIVRVLDLCTGSGAIAISLKHELPDLEIHATDISAKAIEVARANADRLLPKNNQINFYAGDLYSALPSANKSSPVSYSLIVSNPPYIPTHEIDTLSPEVQNEPRFALDGGDDGLDIIRRIVEGAPEHLQRGGTLLLEADPRQMDDITAILKKRGFVDIQLFKDLSGADRVIGGRFY